MLFVLVSLVVQPIVFDSGARAGGASLTGQERVAWVDKNVTFTAGGLTIYATFRHPTSGPSVPGVLLIAGSGSTDRNGGAAGNLKALADWLSGDDVASLRYDKLGSGVTGLGPYASDPGAIGIAPYEKEAASAFRFLAAQPDVEAKRLGVIGHSEGALFALLLATGHAGAVPPVHALGLLEPLSERYLTLITEQFDAQFAGESQARQAEAAVASAVAQMRATGTVNGYPPYGISDVLNPSTAKFLSQADRFDPATLGAELAPGTPVLVSCSDADKQISCADVAHLKQGLNHGHADVEFLHLHNVDHVLKVDPSGYNYTEPLPFSPQLKAALAAFVRRNL